MTLIPPDDWRPQGVLELEDRAWEALREIDRSVCVTAGAGAGKTEFLSQKAAYLLQTGLCPAPKRILAISFKRDAAKTLADRVRLRVGEQQARRFVSVTFDAFTKSLVDQFRQAIPDEYRPTVDYEIGFPTAASLNDFMRRLEIEGINARQLERAIEVAALPVDGAHIPERWRVPLREYWRDQYAGPDGTYLTFSMLNRLAQYLLQANPMILRLLRATYPIVFLDEFQDTTKAQFQFLLNAFAPDRTKFTAVGDDKQRIMGWAGAMENAFTEFTQRCNARPISLLLNWRSHADLVAIQHLIARHIDPAVEEVQARRPREVDGDVSSIWEFADREEEISELAAWIAAQVDLREIRPEDIAVLVRMRANDVEDELAPALAEHGIALRNIARNVGDIAIQELLGEPLTEIVLPFMRLGVSKRDPQSWSRANEEMRSLELAGSDDETLLQRIANRCEDIAKTARRFMRDNAPEAESAQGLVQLIIEAVGEDNIRQATPGYSRNADFERVREGAVILLAECLTDADDWRTALDKFEGRDQVPLLTIHKSKGMEFHTIIFFGLDSQSWWSLRPDSGEELNSFFVAFTRAEQRAFFTSCGARGGPIAWLDDLLGDAVPRIAGAP
ncbi:ATP-dependent helicase (plasmid) [Erythrobacteraceae bacterium WH01K]|nr:ATP-dependent helicase [Erythrobacteraceae bacterium WH01K]